MTLIARFAVLAVAAGGLYGQTPSISAETARLVFEAAPLRGGSVAQQVDGAVKQLKKGGQVVKLRAFVTAGTDPNAVTAAIDRAFSAKPRPVVSVVQIGRLPDAAVVLLEGVVASKKIENPNGLAFISGQLTQAAAGDTKTAVAPLAERSVANLKTLAAGVEVNPADVVRVDCFTSSVEDHAQVRAVVSGTFPKASVSVMQIQRAPTNHFVECDAVGRLHAKATEAVRLVNPTQAAFAQSAIVTAPRVIFTTIFPSTSSDDAGVRSALGKMKSAVETGGSSADRIFYVYAYPGNQAMLDKFRALRFEFLVRAMAPASTNLVFEGAAGATLGVDAIAVPLK